VAVAYPAPPLTADAERTAVLDSTPSSTVIFIFLGLAIATVIGTLYTLWKFWPTEVILQSRATVTPVHVFWMTKHVSIEVRLFVVVALAGALGGLLHSTRSFAWYVGHSSLKYRWFAYYIGMVFIGAGLATIVYVVIRGGIVSGKAAPSDINPYGFAAIGAIVGLFSEQALEMLRRVATDFFAEAPQGADTAPNTEGGKAATDFVAQAPAVQALDPQAVAASTATLVGIVTPGGGTATYHFDYGKTADYGLSTAEGDLSGADPVDVTVDVTDLTPGSVYHYRLVAANGVDIVNGDDRTFTTAAV
jgi:hypothetical protein